MLFSQRKGFKSFKDAIQKNDVDEELRNGLWNVFHVCLWSNIKYNTRGLYDAATIRGSNLHLLFDQYWHSYFKRPLDTLPEFFEEAHQIIRKYFLSCPWYEIYDFIEFTAINIPDPLVSDFISFSNNVLERELSAYRLIDKKIVEISSQAEIDSIEQAISDTTKHKNVQIHLSTALSLLADRKNPNFRNSIKESISAVEALVKNITSDEKATLGEALKMIEKEGKIHPAFKSSLSSLYGYTSDADGIRHSLLEKDNLTYVDAKFMLVSCTAFINYFLGKIAND